MPGSAVRCYGEASLLEKEAVNSRDSEFRKSAWKKHNAAQPMDIFRHRTGVQTDTW
jgi:hypothetical protein